MLVNDFTNVSKFMHVLMHDEKYVCFVHFFWWVLFFLDVCGCGLWWFGYEWGLSAGGFQSICCCFGSRVFTSYFTWDCTGDYLRLYLRCLWYLCETILEILFGFLCEIMYLIASIYYTYIYIYTLRIHVVKYTKNRNVVKIQLRLR